MTAAANARERCRHVEPPGVGRRPTRRAGGVRVPTSRGRRRGRAARRRDRAARPLRRLGLGDEGADLAAAHEGGIDELLADQQVEHGLVLGEMFGLPAHRLFPVDPEPGEVVVDALLEFRRAALEIDVLDAQQEPPACARRPFAVENRRKRMAEMQFAIGARREAEDRSVIADRRGLKGALADCYLQAMNGTRARCAGSPRSTIFPKGSTRFA